MCPLLPYSGVTPMGSGWANPQAPRLRGHPQGAPSLKHSSWHYSFIKVPLSNTFFPIVSLRNSHNDAFHKLIKWQNYLGALSKGRGGGGWGSNFTYVSYNTGMCCPNGWSLHKKICKHRSHFDPPKDPETWVKFVENRINLYKKSWRKFWKISRPT